MIRQIFLSLAAVLIAITMAISQDSARVADTSTTLSDHRLSQQSNTSKTTAIKDTTSVVKNRADTVLIIKHEYNHREQIITGSVIMACLIGMLAFMNNYNPR